MYAGGEHNFSLAALVLGIANPFQIADDDFKRVSRHVIELRRNVLTYYEEPEAANRLFTDNKIALLFANYGSQQVTLMQKSGVDKIIWLQQVENTSRRDALWDKIISGEVPDEYSQ